MDCTRETCHALADLYKTAEQPADDAVDDQSSHSQQTRFILPNQDSSMCQTKIANSEAESNFNDFSDEMGEDYPFDLPPSP